MASPRLMLNCVIAALWLWLGSKGKQYIWARRSHAFAGVIPHTGYSERVGLRGYRSIEYRPLKNRRWSRSDCVILFDGQWIVSHYKLVAVRRHLTHEMALNDFLDDLK